MDYRRRGTDALPVSYLLLLVEQLARPGSRFWSKVDGVERLSPVEEIAADIWFAITATEERHKRHWLTRKAEAIAEQKAVLEQRRLYKRAQRIRGYLRKQTE